MVSFDVVLHFIRVQITEVLNLLTQHFNEDILRLFRHVPTSFYFTFQSVEHPDSVTFGFTTVSCDCQPLHGETDNPLTPLPDPFCYHLSPMIKEARVLH
jgi:hypothetical protein